MRESRGVFANMRATQAARALSALCFFENENGETAYV